VAIGVNWAEVWAPVWAPVWTQNAPTPPTPAPTTPTVGGTRRKQRLYVEIDNQYFPVKSFQEAQQLLLQARALAERQSEEKSERVTKVLRKKAKVPTVKIQAPVIEVAPELKANLAPLINDIDRLYKQAAQVAELRLLMALAEDDEDDDVFLLLN
jgi:hypothetical protein